MTLLLEASAALVVRAGAVPSDWRSRLYRRRQRAAQGDLAAGVTPLSPTACGKISLLSTMSRAPGSPDFPNQRHRLRHLQRRDQQPQLSVPQPDAGGPF
ncbi:hypothetical protein M8494_04625 [Serratia ureilytica]